MEKFYVNIHIPDNMIEEKIEICLNKDGILNTEDAEMIPGMEFEYLTSNVLQIKLEAELIFEEINNIELEQFKDKNKNKIIGFNFVFVDIKSFQKCFMWATPEAFLYKEKTIFERI